LKKSAKYPLYDHDLLHAQENFMVIGMDEAGRGPLAGPVAGAAVILDLENPIVGLNDSKKLRPQKRDEIYDEIIHRAIGWSVELISENEIDRINILEASLLGMKTAAMKLNVDNPVYLTDGNCAISGLIPQIKIIGGDSLSASIAAASIIAKVTRDRYMIELSSKYPEYGFDRHFGYATKDHFTALEKYGPCPIHRMSFKPVRLVFERKNGFGLFI
jgi:ribonuclease HII